MPRPTQYYEFMGTIIANTAQALQIRYEHPEHGITREWFPKSQIVDDYDITDSGEQVLQVAMWLADKKEMRG